MENFAGKIEILNLRKIMNKLRKFNRKICKDLGIIRLYLLTLSRIKGRRLTRIS